MEDLEKLTRKRGTIKAKVTIFSKFIDTLIAKFPDFKITDSNLLNELKDRTERFGSVLDEFEQIQMEIDQITTEPAAQFKERESFDKDFHCVFAKAKTCRNKSVDFSNASATGSIDGSVHSIRTGTGIDVGGFGCNNSIKLPVIELPKFDGNYDNWLEFRDSFNSLIHQNQSISDIQRFHYLRASLSRGALEVIASLEFSSSNYTTAWDLICKRYNNNRILTQNHVKALFNLDKINEESSFSLRKIIDSVTKHLRALKILDEPIENWNTLIIHLISTKLDPTSAREWEQKKASYDKPSLENLQEFLRDRADFLESLGKDTKKFSKNKVELTRTKTFLNTQVSCPFCNLEHYIQDCADFKKLSVNDRLNQVKKKKLCINCLRPGHLIKQCRSSSCKTCKGRHNSLLHFSDSSTDNQEKESTSNSESIVCSSQNISCFNNVLLSTVSVRIFDNNNKMHLARALLDSGSQSSFITSSLAKKLNLNLSRIDIKVCGVNQAESVVKNKTSLLIHSRYNNFSTKVACLVVPEITGTLPNFPIDCNSLQIPGHLQLADPDFHRPGKIDILLGADHFWHLICVGQIEQTKHGAILQKTKLGWIISGSVCSNSPNVVQCHLSTHFEIDRQLSRFWEVEEVSTSRPLSQEEKLCESHFVETVRRSEAGQFIVTIPLKENPDVLGNSFENAKKRLLSLERKFERQPEFKREYFKFINEYIALGHMAKIRDKNTLQPSYFLPHHGVVKESSLTTKLRVVFDASCATSSGYSLNDIQRVGATIQPDLLSALIRFRKYNYVIAGDVEKMYRMCLINPEQRALQRILWRENPDSPVEIYELATVTYGTSSAAFLAIRCLYQIGLDCAEESPVISEIIKNHFYVDDFLSGADSANDAILIANEVARKLEKGCFRLRKWISNSPEVLAHIQSHNKTSSIDFGAHENAKTLGLIWNAQTDSLTYSISNSVSKKVTKRSILSETSQIFDPLGLLSPSIIIAKLILQELWSEKLSWDESLPNHLHSRWLQFHNELKSLNGLKINRQVTCSDLNGVEIHGFADASIRAIGACIYARSRNNEGVFQVELICAKSRVAPLKTQTVPRLELMAALLLVQLVEKVKASLNICLDRVVYWSDSTVVLGWLKTEPNLLQTFVANRVARIQELVEAHHWRHVPTAENPADPVSRGVMPKDLATLKIYWNGPNWLKCNESTWPIFPGLQTDLPEFRNNIHSHVETSNMSFSLFEKYSDVSKLERVVAYCLRFRENCSRKRADRYSGPLLCRELTRASLLLSKMSQCDLFQSEINILVQNPNKLKGPIAKLSPFLDSDGIIRVGGRLTQSGLLYNKKHPILLSSKHVFTKLLFKREHMKLLHAGPQQILYSLRENFWPLSARSLARKTVYECVKCFRARPKVLTPLMGNLPKNRVSPAPPFYVTGVDYCGPFLIKDRKGRGCKVTKCYVSLFICFATRAIHLELVSDLTKDAFIAALRRFIARRGKPYQIYSDNGINFVAASSDLKPLGIFLKLNANDLTCAIENEGIVWSFIPAHSPHFGGLWEAGVKATKHHLKRVAGNVKLTFELLSTLLAQIEAVLNSRPISPLSSDPSDLTPLCPAHFLIGRPLTTAADPDLLEIKINRLDQYQQIQQLQQHFWKRWSLEYISELQERQKWLKPERSLEIDDLVVIKDDNQPPLKWLLGRVIDLHPGTDGIARVATVKTANGVAKRSFAKLCPLPIRDMA